MHSFIRVNRDVLYINADKEPEEKYNLKKNEAYEQVRPRVNTSLTTNEAYGISVVATDRAPMTATTTIVDSENQPTIDSESSM